MLYSINWPNYVVWLPLLLEILGNICITTVFYPGCDVIKFETTLIFLIKLFCYLTKKSIQKFKCLENKKSFWGEIKSIFNHFESAFNCQKLSQTWEWVFHYVSPQGNVNTKLNLKVEEICRDCSATFLWNKWQRTRILFSLIRDIFITLLNTWYEVFFKNSQRLNTVKYFCRKLHFRCFAEFWIRY